MDRATCEVVVQKIELVDKELNDPVDFAMAYSVSTVKKSA